MTQPKISVDHAIVFVRDIEQAAAQYRRLGFFTGPRFDHETGGFSNYNMMFEHDYLELLLPRSQTERNLARFKQLENGGDGLKDLSIAVPSMDIALKHYAAAGMDPLPPIEWKRPFTLDGREVEARFRVAYLPADKLLPGVNVHMVEHLSRELVWRPEYQTHPNSARALRRLVVVTHEPEKFAVPYAAMFGSSVRDHAGGVSVAAGQMDIFFFTPTTFATLNPGIHFKAQPPFMASLDVRVRNVAAARAHIDQHGVPYKVAKDGAIEISPDQACGVLLRLTEN